MDRFGVPDPPSRRLRTRLVRALADRGLVARDNGNGRTVVLLGRDGPAAAGEDGGGGGGRGGGGGAPVDHGAYADAASLDVPTEASRRVEQAFLRRVLLAGRPSAPCAFCGLVWPAGLLVAAHLDRRAGMSREERLDFRACAVLACAVGCDALYYSPSGGTARSASPGPGPGRSRSGSPRSTGSSAPPTTRRGPSTSAGTGSRGSGASPEPRAGSTAAAACASREPGSADRTCRAAGPPGGRPRRAVARLHGRGPGPVQQRRGDRGEHRLRRLDCLPERVAPHRKVREASTRPALGVLDDAVAARKVAEEVWRDAARQHRVRRPRRRGRRLVEKPELRPGPLDDRVEVVGRPARDRKRSRPCGRPCWPSSEPTESESPWSLPLLPSSGASALLGAPVAATQPHSRRTVGAVGT